MTERAGEPMVLRGVLPNVLRGLLLGLVLVDAALLGVLEMMFTPVYLGAVPVPVGALLALVSTPGLVWLAADVSDSPVVLGAPVAGWLLAIALLGLTGPGADVLLPLTWQSALLLAAGLGAGWWTVRRALEEGRAFAQVPADPAAPGG